MFNHQEKGINWLMRETLKGHRVLALADDPGLGKSAQVILALKRMCISPLLTLIICPAGVKSHWVDQYRRWNADAHHPPRIESYEYAVGHNAELASKMWDALILDEWHYAKNPDALRTRVLLGRDALVSRARFAWLLSGTPMPNTPADLYVFLRLTGAIKLTFNQFIREYCEIRKFHPYAKPQITGTKTDRLPELKAMLYATGRILRRTRQDTIEYMPLPDIKYHNLPVTPDANVDLALAIELIEHVTIREDWQRVLVDKIRAQYDRALALSQSISDADLFFARLSTLSSALAQLRVYLGLRKIKSTSEIVTKALIRRECHKIVVFAVHRSVIAQMQILTRALRPLVITGSTTPANRATKVRLFQTSPRHRLMICQVQAGGIGIDLTEADRVIMLESSWSPSVNVQAVKRAHRIGQTRPVNVYQVILRDDPLDSRIASILREKQENISYLFS